MADGTVNTTIAINDQFSKTLEKFESKIESLINALDRVNASLARFGNSSGSFATGASKINRALDDVSSKSKAVVKDVNKAASAINNTELKSKVYENVGRKSGYARNGTPKLSQRNEVKLAEEVANKKAKEAKQLDKIVNYYRLQELQSARLAATTKEKLSAITAKATAKNSNLSVKASIEAEKIRQKAENQIDRAIRDAKLENLNRLTKERHKASRDAIRFAEIEARNNIRSIQRESSAKLKALEDAARLERQHQAIGLQRSGKGGGSRTIGDVSTLATVLGTAVDELRTLALTYLGFQGAGFLLKTSDDLTLINARLDLIKDKHLQLNEVQGMVFRASEASRSSYAETARTVARIGTNAGNAFKSTEELVAFAEILNKHFVVGGSTLQEQRSALIQLTQAMGSGILRGEELNSVFESAPSMIKAIAAYLDVPIGKIREMAAEGKITTQIVKNAIMNSSIEITEKMNQMPRTFAQIWQSFKNHALIAFKPLYDYLQKLAQSKGFASFIDGMLYALQNLSFLVMKTIEYFGKLKDFIVDNMHIIEPMIWAVVTAFAAWKAVTMAQALWASIVAIATNSIALAIIGVIAVIYLCVAAFNYMTGESVSALGAIFAAITFVVVSFVNLVLVIYNSISAIVNMLYNVIGMIISHVKSRWYGLLSWIAETVADITGFFGADDTAKEWAAKKESYDKKVSELNVKYDKHRTFEAEVIPQNLKYFDATESAKKAYNFGDKVEGSMQDWLEKAKGTADKLQKEAFGDIGKEFLPDKARNNPALIAPDAAQRAADQSLVKGIKNDTDKIANNTDKWEEERKYILEAGERRAINRFTTAEVHLTTTQNNNISKEADVEIAIDAFVEKIKQAMLNAAEGVHV